MLRDYELALSNYRLISTDYKLDKAWKRYAGVQVASILLSQLLFSLVAVIVIFFIAFGLCFSKVVIVSLNATNVE